MINRLLHAVRGVYPDMPDLVAGALADMWGRDLLPVLIDAQRFQFLAIAADDPDGPESLAMAGVEPDAAFDALPPSGQMRAGLDMAMAAYGTPVPDVGATVAPAARATNCPTCNGTRCVPGEAYDPPNECPACQDREP